MKNKFNWKKKTAKHNKRKSKKGRYIALTTLFKW